MIVFTTKEPCFVFATGTKLGDALVDWEANRADHKLVRQANGT